MRKLYLLLALAVLSVGQAMAQSNAVKRMWIMQKDSTSKELFKPEYIQVGEKEIIRRIDNEPNFGMYRDNYFITGIPTNKGITRQTADAKFQISIRHRLFMGYLPYHSFVSLTYTQKSFWDIYRDSAPFGDTNYNPSIMVVTPLLHKREVRGMLAVSLEHESNGRDGKESRSWNFLSLSGVYFYNRYFYAQAKLWYGQISREGNPDLLKYRGLGLVALNYRSFTEQYGASVVLNPSLHGLNTRVELSLRLNRRDNYSIFVQWEQGYGESLLNYNKYNSMVRVGIALKPPMRSVY